jgi:hypothetical protein
MRVTHLSRLMLRTSIRFPDFRILDRRQRRRTSTPQNRLCSLQPKLLGRLDLIMRYMLSKLKSIKATLVTH